MLDRKWDLNIALKVEREETREEGQVAIVKHPAVKKALGLHGDQGVLTELQNS